MPKKAMSKILWIISALIVSTSLLTGCAQALPASVKTDLTASQAAEIIYHDLTYHGISVGKVTVTHLTFSDRNTSLATVTYTTAEGKNVTQQVNLKKISGQWEIPDHSH